MGLNAVPSGERVHIGFFGRRNAGKSSLVNAVTDQEISVVSDTKGTTTDPVNKSMELLPLGPVVIIDTPGFDDEGALGEKRVQRAKRVLNRTDIAVLVADAENGMGEADRELVRLFEEKEIPYIIVFNKADLLEEIPDTDSKNKGGEKSPLYVSALTGAGIHALKEKLAGMGQAGGGRKIPLIEDLVKPSEIVLLVIPIDKAAPKGRLILPQQMTIRGILDADGIPVCVKQDRLGEVLERFGGGEGGCTPGLVITDSQVFEEVAAAVPQSIPLTSFSILMARYKGFLDEALRGVLKIDALEDGDTVLISEGCTHHRQCGDIGTVKLPAWIRKRTGKDIRFETSSGTGFPEDLGKYAMVIHCGGCMLNEREMRFRMKCAADQGIPFTNYGTAIAHMKGILDRSTEIVRKKH